MADRKWWQPKAQGYAPPKKPFKLPKAPAGPGQGSARRGLDSMDAPPPKSSDRAADEPLSDYDG